MKRFDLMWEVNARGTFVCSRACLPHLLRAENPHILNLAPPLDLDPIWFAPHLPYTMAKYGMSLCVLGMAEEFRDRGVAVNALWPRTVIATAALRMVPGMGDARGCRKPDILADAAHAILTSEAASTSGNFFLDEDVLRAAGVEDFEPYAVEPGHPLLPDFFLEESRELFRRRVAGSRSEPTADGEER
jgi:citronellol/citronellal dehydrogenase